MKYGKVVAVGCSYVKGLQESESHFAKVISNHFEAEYVNLGKHGSSNDYSYYRTIEWLNENDIDSLLVVFGLTAVMRIHHWNNIINDHDTLWMSYRGFNPMEKHQILEYGDKFTPLSDLESEENIRIFGDFYMKYLYNEDFFRKKIEQKLLLLHTLLEKSNSKLIVFNSLDEFEPTQNCLNFFRFVTEENNWKSHCVDKHKNEGWEWNGHPSEYANLDLGKRIINFLGEQNEKI